MTTLWFCFCLFLSVESQSVCPDPIRYRQPWFSLSTEQHLLYAEGMQLLRDSGKLDILSAAHSTGFMGQIHQSSLFLYYHSYLIWETETAIRDLGGKFACFGMPFYDWTLDHGKENDPEIFHSGIGGDGDIDNNHCVHLNRYTTPNLCAENEIYPYCCLKRAKSDQQTLYTSHQMMETIQNINSEDFENAIRPSHAGIHRFIGAVPEAHMEGGYAFDDPIFQLAHSYMDLIRILWADCQGYTAADDDISEITEYSNDMYHSYCYELVEFDPGNNCGLLDGMLGLDDELIFYFLKDVDWSIVGRGDKISVRKLFNFEKEFNVTFDLQPFYDNFAGFKKFCDGRKQLKKSSYAFGAAGTVSNDVTWTKSIIYGKEFLFIVVVSCIIFIYCICVSLKKETVIMSHQMVNYGSV